jgi:hypothetical protein
MAPRLRISDLKLRQRHSESQLKGKGQLGFQRGSGAGSRQKRPENRADAHYVGHLLRKKLLTLSAHACQIL